MILGILVAATIALVAPRLAPRSAGPGGGVPLAPVLEPPPDWTGVRVRVAGGADATLAETATDELPRRHLPAPAFALRADETLHPLVPPGPFTARIDVVTTPPAAGQVHLGVALERARAVVHHRGEAAHVDAATDGEGRRRSVAATPVRTAGSAFAVSAEVRTATGFGRSPSAAGIAAGTAFTLLARPVDRLEPARLDARGGPWPGRDALAGRALAETRGCVACHVVPRDGVASDAVPGVAPPLLGPDATRLRGDFIRRVLEDPAAVRAHARMPRLFDPTRPGDRAAIEDLVHFLVREQWRTAPTDGRSPIPARPGDGPALWRAARCGACHGPAPAARAGDARRMVDQRERVAVETDLARALERPHAAWPGGRMPDLRLPSVSAAFLASWLTGATGDAPAADLVVDDVRAERGASAYVRRGCVRCHAGDGRAAIAPAAPRPAAPARALAAAIASARGCVGDGPPAPGRPSYALDARERRHLAAWAREQAGAGAAAACPPDDLALDLERLGCTTCHAFGAALPAASARGPDLLRQATSRRASVLAAALGPVADEAGGGARCPVELPAPVAAAVASRLRRATGRLDDPPATSSRPATDARRARDARPRPP